MSRKDGKQGQTDKMKGGSEPADEQSKRFYCAGKLVDGKGKKSNSNDYQASRA